MKDGDPGLYIELMLDAAIQALPHVKGLSEQEFLSSRLNQDAVSMCLVVIGENARRLIRAHPDVIERHSAVAWLDMAHMRDRIAHGYEKLQMQVVWKTVTTDLRPLVDMLEPILASLPDPDSPAIS
jgi:uncharacterized protein with HEPN domain